MAFSKSKKEYKLLVKELEKVEKQEEKLLAYKPKDSEGITEKIRAKIPDKARNGLEIAFKEGFSFLLEDGSFIIEKSGGLEKTRDKTKSYHGILRQEVALLSQRQTGL